MLKGRIRRSEESCLTVDGMRAWCTMFITVLADDFDETIGYRALREMTDEDVDIWTKLQLTPTRRTTENETVMHNYAGALMFDYLYFASLVEQRKNQPNISVARRWKLLNVLHHMSVRNDPHH